METAGATVAMAAATASAADIAELQQKLVRAEAALYEKDQELNAMRNILASADNSRADEVQRSQLECRRCVAVYGTMFWSRGHSSAQADFLTIMHYLRKYMSASGGYTVLSYYSCMKAESC